MGGGGGDEIGVCFVVCEQSCVETFLGEGRAGGEARPVIGVVAMCLGDEARGKGVRKLVPLSHDVGMRNGLHATLLTDCNTVTAMKQHPPFSRLPPPPQTHNTAQAPW